MSHSSSSPHQTHAQRTADGILVAATELYATQDAQRVTVDQIARGADVAVGSISVHYGTKERLYLEVVTRALELCTSHTARRAWSPSPMARVRNTGEAFVDFALAHPLEFRIVAERATERSGLAGLAEAEARIAELVRQSMLQLATDVHQAMGSGEIRTMPVEQVVGYFWVLWVGIIGLTTRGDVWRFPVDAIRPMLSDAADILERGLAPDASEGETAQRQAA
jgi:AcrR family transcriptional regulator